MHSGSPLIFIVSSSGIKQRVPVLGVSRRAFIHLALFTGKVSINCLDNLPHSRGQTQPKPYFNLTKTGDCLVC